MILYLTGSNHSRPGAPFLIVKSVCREISHFSNSFIASNTGTEIFSIEVELMGFELISISDVQI